MGLPPERVAAPLRFSLSPTTTADTIVQALERIPDVLDRVRLLTAALQDADA
jgi:cysteine sulfinate desulfinase/cysteine desulfurase-like protein